MNFKPFEKFRGRICVDGDFLRSYERSKQKEDFFINYEMPFIQSISLKNESDYMQLIKEGYQAAAGRESSKWANGCLCCCQKIIAR